VRTRRADLPTTSGGRNRGSSRGCFAIITVLVVAIVSSQPASGCSVCFGAEDSMMTAGMNNAILVLLLVVAAVQGGFAALFLSLRQRARRARQRQTGSSPSLGGSS
jgi:FAD/FMN-containing dehydrogenase